MGGGIINKSWNLFSVLTIGISGCYLVYFVRDCVFVLCHYFWCRLIVSEFMVIVVYVLLGWRYLDRMIVCNKLVR